MSHRSSNGVRLTKCDSQQWHSSSLETSVKLAGEEAKDRLYEPKHKKKVVRALTVVAYVFFVSLAAIMLSLYYVFLWKGGEGSARYAAGQARGKERCDNVAVAARQNQLPPTDISTFDIVTPNPTIQPYIDDAIELIPSTTEENVNNDNKNCFGDINMTYEDSSNQEIERFNFIKKLIKSKRIFNEND